MLCVPVRFLSQACSPFFHSVFYLSFQAALALNCGTRNLESVAPSFVTQALQSRLSSCSMQALLPMWHLCSPVRDRTCCSCTRRQILNPWAPGKPPPPQAEASSLTTMSQWGSAPFLKIPCVQPAVCLHVSFTFQPVAFGFLSPLLNWDLPWPGLQRPPE